MLFTFCVLRPGFAIFIGAVYIVECQEQPVMTSFIWVPLTAPCR